MAKLILIYLIITTAILIPEANAENPKQPEPPSMSVPDMSAPQTEVICIGCVEPFFNTETHKKILEKLLNNTYVSELRKALYWQDTYHQFESKAHYDNCDFDSATNYITTLQNEVGQHVQYAKKAKLAGDIKSMQKAVKDAFFALGQAMHAVQDFYAHTNYVELQVLKAHKFTDIEIVKPWRKEGQEQIKNLIREGLISGYVFWGIPQNCPDGTISHANLAKDSADTLSGKILISHLENQTQYNIAKSLAREASINFLEDSFKQWPLLKEVNGPNVAFDVMADRRNI